MRRYLATQEKGEHGRHVYTLAEFGLEAERERERNRAYLESFASGPAGDAIAG